MSESSSMDDPIERTAHPAGRAAWLVAVAVVIVAAGVIGQRVWSDRLAQPKPMTLPAVAVDPDAPAADLLNRANAAYGTQKVELLRQAANAGNIEAMYALGMMLRGGVGVQKDAAEAERWIRQAAEGGHVPAGEILRAIDDTASVGTN